ncbi:MAG: signal peptidase I [Spirochaetia bacterium]
MRSPFTHIVLIALGVCFAAISLYDVKYIDGDSMFPTLRTNQTIFIYRWAYGARLPWSREYIIRWGRIKQNELVFFREPVYSLPVIKRCVGAAGTAIRREGNMFIIGDTHIPLSEIHATELLYLETIPEGKVFLLGDNRKVSLDSRYYGLIDVSRIEGRVLGYN